MFERRTGDSRNDVGLSPGGTVIQVDLEIGSFAGDISLYFAPLLDPPEKTASTRAAAPVSGTRVLALLEGEGASD